MPVYTPLYTTHDAPYLPPKILDNLCVSFLLGITAVPREIENNAYAKFWGANKVHYGRCASGVYEVRRPMPCFLVKFRCVCRGRRTGVVCLDPGCSSRDLGKQDITRPSLDKHNETQRKLGKKQGMGRTRPVNRAVSPHLNRELEGRVNDSV